MNAVHYTSHGRTLAFDCYLSALRAHIDSAFTVTPEQPPGGYAAPRTEYAIASPDRTTNLSKVSCRECWAAIEHLARNNR